MDQLVSTQWLSENTLSEDLVVLDCTVFLTMTADGYESESGRARFDEGHIPGAGFADLNEDLADTTSPYRYALPEPQDFADAMARLGVSDNSRVVLYDDSGAMWAARVWWMLRWIGFDNAAILDGGMKAWRAEGRPVSADASTTVAGSLQAHVRPELIARQDEVKAAIDDGATCLIDALPSASFTGKVNIYGRPGHIPTATNTSATSLITETGHYAPLEDLRGRFDADPTTRVIHYCGGGIAASSTAFIQTLLGYEDVAVYTTSLQEWANIPDAPMTVES